MPEQPNRTFVTSLLTSLAARTHAETVVLTARLRERCWPGGDDRTDVLAREWLKQRSRSRAVRTTVSACVRAASDVSRPVTKVWFGCSGISRASGYPVARRARPGPAVGEIFASATSCAVE